MGCYIKGMDMPTSCRACLYSRTDIRNVDWCVLTEKDLPCECPIIPVPPHGALIDRDDLFAECPELVNGYKTITDYLVVIPAEPPKDDSPAGTYDLLYEEGGPDA